MRITKFRLLYLSAQEQMVKCELELGRDGQAKQRADKFKQAYPQFTKEMDHCYQFEVESRNSRGKGADTSRAVTHSKAVGPPPPDPRDHDVLRF